MPDRHQNRDIQDPSTPEGLEAWERHPLINQKTSAPESLVGHSLAHIRRAQIEQYFGDGDLRRLNLALKVRDIQPDSGHPDHATQAALAHARQQLHDNIDSLRSATAGAREFATPPAPTSFPALLYGQGSSTAARFRRRVSQAAPSAAYLAATLGHGVYASAWKPADTLPEDDVSVPDPATVISDWAQLGTWFQAILEAQPVVIVGMPVIPGRVLEHAKGLVLNAHNGPLPQMRGLDALAWSLATGTIPTATAHQVVTQVDMGEVLAAVRVDPFPTSSLSRRMKEAQVTALIMALNGSPPPATAQAGPAYFGRMHPDLRKLLSEGLTERNLAHER